MKRTFKIFRFDPSRDKDPHYETFTINAEPTDKILDCLNRVRWEHDPSLVFRASCAHGVCGSDGMRIDAVCALACQRLVRDYGEGPITIDPLPNLPVVKDLVVDIEPFFHKYRSVLPYLLPKGPEPEGERRQSSEERMVFDEAIRCILCGCCTAACPVTAENEKFLGPAALLRAFRYLFDSRDGAASERMNHLDNKDAIWGCKSHGKCTEVCPKDIDVRKALGKTKKRMHDEERLQSKNLT